jgi:hypothetical protein
MTGRNVAAHLKRMFDYIDAPPEYHQVVNTWLYWMRVIYYDEYHHIRSL